MHFVLYRPTDIFYTVDYDVSTYYDKIWLELPAYLENYSRLIYRVTYCAIKCKIRRYYGDAPHVETFRFSTTPPLPPRRR